MKNWMLNRIRRKATESHKIQDFDELYLDVYILSFFIRAAASVFSLFTGFYFLLGIFSAQMTGNTRFILAGVVVFIVESLKYYVTPKGFNNLFKGNWKYGIPTVLVAIPLYLTSVYFTINGVRDYFDDNNQDIEIAVQEKEQKIDSRVVYYDSLIAVEQRKYDKLLEQHEGTRRMGWIAIIEQFNRIEERMDNYREEKNRVLDELKEDEGKDVEEIVKETNALKDNIVYISLSSESLLFLTFLFVQYYLFRAYRDEKIRMENAKKLIQSVAPKKTSSVVIQTPVMGTLQRPKKLTRKEQVERIYKSGITDAKDIANSIGTHYQYVYDLIRKLKKEGKIV